MPTVEPYEILMRRNGQIWALSARSLITLDDGTVIEGKPVPLSGLNDPAFSQIATLVAASKDSEIATLTTERASLQAELTDLQQDYDAKVLELASAKEKLALAQSELEAIRNPPRPTQVTPAQIRIWLVMQGVSLEHVNQFIAAIPDPATREIARIKWEYGIVVLRNDPLVEQFASALGLTLQQMDAAFEQAAEL